MSKVQLFLTLFSHLFDLLQVLLSRVRSNNPFYYILNLSDAIIQLRRIDDLMKEEANHLQEVIDGLHLKHKEYADGIQCYIHNHSVDQTEIKRLAGFRTSSLV